MSLVYRHAWRCVLTLAFGIVAACWSARELPPNTDLPAFPCEPAALPPMGVALSLDWEGPSAEGYGALLWEIAYSGASKVLLAIPIDQAHWDGVPEGVDAARLTLVKEVTHIARSLNLRVVWMPWIRLSTVEPGRWRGTLDPLEPEAWWRSYAEIMRTFAVAARHADVDGLVVGSELGSLEHLQSSWSSLVAELRVIGGMPLTYAANWDRAAQSPLWSVVDEVSVSFYPPLVQPSEPVRSETLRRALRAELRALSMQAARRGRSWQVMEVGYPSARHAALRPWDHVSRSVAEVALQDKLWHAFLEEVACLPHPPTRVFVWNWFGPGGLGDAGYTLRGKPALRRLEQAWRSETFETSP